MEQDFMIYFNIKSVKPVYTSMPDKFYSYSSPPSTSYTGHKYGEEFLEVEISRRGWDELMRYHRMTEKITELERYESHMRRKYPAVKDAHEKYLMLMELYR
jgi:hypothetical protein